ncbi:MAG: prolipoprotein diacylglyceryl transferase [Clostridia bacterium]|nr:prolipoprotein diacylglyceryl transferase [Clostridia bacterium]
MAFSLLAKNPLFGVASDGRGLYIFGLEIYYYALCIVAGMLVAATLSALLMKRRNMSPDFIFLLFIVCIPTAIIGARLFSCLTDEDLGIKRFFDFRNGGMSITGGVIGGVGAGFVVCLIKKVNFLRAADCVVINILIAQAMGRWGNFFNAEVYGGVVSDPAQQWFPFAVPIVSGLSGTQAFGNPNATWHYAFFFYEMLFNMIGWALLFTYAWFRKKKPNGLFTCLYFVWYGAIRMVMEPLRDPSFILDRGGVPWSHVFSILMVGLGIAACMVLMILNFLKEGSFVGSKKGDPCGITNYLTPYKNDEPYFSKINMFGSNYPPRPSKEERKKKKAEKRNEEKSDTPPDKDNDENGNKE